MHKLRIIFLAGALAVITVPGRATDLPDYGSKNFSPSGDTPSYFANETAPVSARTADTTQSDWSAVDDIAPARPTFEGTRSASTHSGRHGRFAIGHRSAGRSTGRVHWVHATSSGGKAVRAVHNGARATTAKHGKPGGRHVSASLADYTIN